MAFAMQRIHVTYKHSVGIWGRPKPVRWPANGSEADQEEESGFTSKGISEYTFQFHLFDWNLSRITLLLRVYFSSPKPYGLDQRSQGVIPCPSSHRVVSRHFNAELCDPRNKNGKR